MSYKAKLLLFEMLVFALAATIYMWLFYDTYKEFYAEVLGAGKTLFVAVGTMSAKKPEEGGDTSA